MKYSQIPVDTFERIQLNAGMLLDDFDPDTGVVGNLLGATTGGINFTVSHEYQDYGDDIDNCPKNMLELKRLDSIEATMSGTFVTMNAETAKSVVGAADMDGTNHIIPRKDLEKTDFKDLWWVGDYSDVNNGETAGFIAIHMMNTLSTGGFQIQTTDRAKGNFAFEYMAHFSMDAQDTVPYEIFIVKGETPTVTHTVTQNLTNCTSSFTDDSVNDGTAFTATLTADEDYTMSGATVTVTMGNEALPNAYDNGVVTIDSVTDDVVITATAVYTGA